MSFVDRQSTGRFSKSQATTVMTPRDTLPWAFVARDGAPNAAHGTSTSTALNVDVRRLYDGPPRVPTVDRASARG